MKPFYVRVTMPCGARGLYFEGDRCATAADELREFRGVAWPVVRLRLQRRRLAYQEFVSPRDARMTARTADVDVVPRRLATQVAQPCGEQRLMAWGR